MKKVSPKKVYLVLVTIIISVFLSSCGDSGATVDEAYRVGYYIGIADECGGRGVIKEPMPSAYDDSLDDGELTSAFQSGYWAARNESRPCKCP